MEKQIAAKVAKSYFGVKFYPAFTKDGLLDAGKVACKTYSVKDMVAFLTAFNIDAQILKGHKAMAIISAETLNTATAELPGIVEDAPEAEPQPDDSPEDTPHNAD